MKEALILLFLLLLSTTPQLSSGEWATTSHESGGYAWQLNGTDLTVVLADTDDLKDEWTRGLYFISRGFVYAAWSDPSYTPGVARWIPPIIVSAFDGVDPAIDTTDSLILQVQGSGEHGCANKTFDNVTVTIDVQVLPEGVFEYSVQVRVQGIVYLLFPLRRGRAFSDGYTIVGGVTLESGGTLGLPPPNIFRFYRDTNVFLTNVSTVNIRYYAGFLKMIRRNEVATYLGPTKIEFATPISWLQLYNTSYKFIEIDMDHACETPDLIKPDFTVSYLLKRSNST